MGPAAGQVYEFGPFRLEPEEHRLLLEGKPTPLTPKAFELLVFLVRNQGRLLTKDQIMEAVWPGSFVEDGNITVLISSLRKVLADAETGEPYIQTVPKKGYRFTAGVKEAGHIEAEPEAASKSADVTVPLQEPAASPSAWRRNIRIFTLALLVSIVAMAGYLRYIRPPAKRSLAVLPLENLRHDPDIDFLGFSLADAVITKLGLLSSITVRPSTAVERYRGHSVEMQSAAAELKVDMLLTGNFIRDSGHLRITYQVVDARASRILVTDAIELKYDELLAVHDDVAKRIVNGLQLKLSPAEAERIKPDAPMNALAYEYYLRGVDLMGSHNFPLAVKMLEKSAEIDPKYAQTWAYLGQSYTSDAAFQLAGREQYRRAQAAYERALALQPKQIEAQMFLANLLVDTGRVEQAMPLLRDALAGNPNQADVHWELGYAYRFAGMLKQSVAECERAREIDPMVQGNGAVLNTYLYLGQYDDFLRSLPGAGESAFFRFYRGFGEYHQGHFDAAAADFDRAYRDDPTLYTGIGKAFADAIAGKKAAGLQMLRELENKIRQRGVGDPEATYKIAQGYAALGDRTSGISALRASIENGFFPFPYLERDPLLNNLRAMPDFPHLLEMARQRYEAFRKRFF